MFNSSIQIKQLPSNLKSDQQIKNLRKNILQQTNFKYGSKKISFNVKSRSEYWDELEKNYNDNKNVMDYYLINEVKKILDGTYDTSSSQADTILNSPISPVLATTLIMLNESLFKCKIFYDYLYNDKHQVYASTHWNGKSFSGDNAQVSLTIDNPFDQEKEEYKRILPGYGNIDIMKLYQGYQVLSKSYTKLDTELKPGNVSTVYSKYFGSYNIDTGRFQRIFKTKPDISSSTTSTVEDISDLLDINKKPVELLNKYPEIDSYYYADGLFKRLKESPYNSQSYQISVLRGSYGFGPLIISSFLKAKDFTMSKITDIISGLLIATDSGMILIDAIKGIQEWRGINTDSDISALFEGTTDIQILKFLEYIGAMFFTTILGSSLKDTSLFNIPLTSKDRKLYDIGYLMGSNYSAFIDLFKNGIKNKVWLQDSTEIFSFEIPCVLYGTTPTSGLFKTGDYVKNFSDSLLLGSEPMDTSFKISKVLEREKELSNYIIPQSGYSIFDFVTRGLNKTIIDNVLKNVEYLISDFYLSSNSEYNYKLKKKQDISNIYDYIPVDYNVAPRTTSDILDPNYATCLYSSKSTTGTIIPPSDLTRISSETEENPSVLIGDEKIYLIDESRGYKFATSLLYLDSNNKLKTDGYYLIDSVTGKKFVVLHSDIATDCATYDDTLAVSTTQKFSEDYPKSCRCFDIQTKEIYDFTICYYPEVAKYKIVDLQTKPETEIIDSTSAYNSLYLTSPSSVFDIVQTLSLNGINVFGQITALLNSCGFNPLYLLTETEKSEDEKLKVFIDRLALCVLKISAINSFCTSYSLDLLSLSDTTKSFYEIYKSYIGDYVEVKQEIRG